MKIYKEKQFLVFDFEDGKTVKYDFATKTCIGKSGKKVKNLCSQLSGLTIDQLCDYCADKQYGKFLRYVKNNGDIYCKDISNIGTILNRVPHFANLEQIFSAGIEDIVDTKNFNHTINDIPKGVIKLCKNHDIKLSNNFLEFYKQNPDAYLLSYNLEYTSLNDNDIYDILSCYDRKRIQYGDKYYEYTYKNCPRFITLINEYGYTAKALLHYLDYCKTFEAIESMDFLTKELLDYASMMKRISNKFDKYPRHFLTTHRIACRNYNRLKEQFVEEDFKKHINKDMEKTFDDYCFIYPDCTQDIKDESVQMSNCVSSYIKRVINGECHILFLRYKDSPNKSLVTIEVKNNKIVQALQKYNNPLTDEQKDIVEKWNVWWSKKIKEDDKTDEVN